MSRTVLHGGRIFDGTGSPPADGDLLIEDGRIAEVGTGLDADEQVDVTGMTLLPGLFDCHVHVTSSGVDLLRRLQRPFSYQFYEAARNLAATLDCGITTVRDAGGADLGIQRAVDDGLIDGPRMRIAVNVLSKAQEVIEVHRASFGRAVAAGVKVAMGTDSGVGPHGGNLEELARWPWPGW